MKKIIKSILIVSIIGLSVYCVSCVSIVRIKGNSNIINTEETVSEFEKINISGSAEVHFYASDEYRAILTIDENLKEYIIISTKDNTLNIGVESGCYISPTKFTVDVYCPVLTGVSISGSGIFKNSDTITATTFESKITGSGKMEGDIVCGDYSAKISGSGKINGAIECDNYSVTISGSGKVTTHGNSSNVDISISGSGKFDGNEFYTNNANINISGSGNASLYIEDYLNAVISGSGKVNYGGNPKIDSNIRGSGQIKSM